MTRLVRAGQVNWQLAFGFDYPSGTPPIIIPVPPETDQTGNIDYYRRYLLDGVPVSLGDVTGVISVEVNYEDIPYLRRHLCDN